jgi:DNA-binding transcriptional ArsR family regulator
VPKLAAAEPTTRAPSVQFVFSPALDMMNAMYFTRLVVDSEGVEGWPVALREQMAPDLLSELDFLYTYPKGQPGIMGQLGDILFSAPEAWPSVDALIGFVRSLPAGLGTRSEPGIQGLVFYVAGCDGVTTDRWRDPGASPRDALAEELDESAIDVLQALALYDRPEELRARMIALIERFWDEHYKDELPKRRSALERSVAAHAGENREQAIETVRRISGRPTACLEDVCPGPYESLVFAPSVDVGPYLSCADVTGTLHGMFYPCDPQFVGAAGSDVIETQRLARIYKALSDEQRLRILQMLREREMYGQEIVDRLDLHQSVVSRHLIFLKAVGLVRVRKQNNMKHYSLNPEITGELSKTLDLFAGAATGGGTR